MKRKSPWKKMGFPRVLTMKGMDDVFKLLDGYLAFFDENNPNCKRSAKVARLMKEANACYTELYRESRHCSVQSSLDKFFRKQDSTTRLNQPTLSPSLLWGSQPLPSFDVFNLDEDLAPH
ncbi:hypothetical protein Y1Q_0008620 [Alligator mississippiensis]|uniref:Uncharacterized protein n=1 Tax=Alligator mississippiensis TaxID=8496 RepID=A0A151N979_ALLMI|nr:hypothetical protein Y1Q_0008620 [Alligator mississippiensis]